MDLRLEVSDRQCYRGHLDTFAVEGTDAESVEWLGGWDLWCRTCEALVLDVDQRASRSADPVEKGAIGYVVSVPVILTIVERTPAERWPGPGAEPLDLRYWSKGVKKKGEVDEGS